MIFKPTGTSNLVYVVDDDKLIRNMLVAILESLEYRTQNFEDGISFLQKLEELDRGAVILDVNMPKLNGIQVLSSLQEQGLDWPVIVMSGQADLAMAVEAMKNGAYDFIEKPFSVGTVAKALEETFAKSSGQKRPGAGQNARAPIEETLSAREIEVLDKLVSGQQNKDIARSLNISHRTVEVHRANIMRRLQANSFAELIRIAISNGVVGEHDLDTQS